MNMKWIFPVLAAGMISLAAHAGHHNEDDDDYDDRHPRPEQIRQWVAQGDILSLEEILRLRPLGGELLDAEVEWEDDVLVYELKWLDSERRRHKTWVNANTGEWLNDKVKDHH